MLRLSLNTVNTFFTQNYVGNVALTPVSRRPSVNSESRFSRYRAKSWACNIEIWRLFLSELRNYSAVLEGIGINVVVTIVYKINKRR